MKTRRIARFWRERLNVLVGRAPSCRWVRLRLGAYHHWDRSLSRLQFGAIETHLRGCAECRAEWEKTSELCHDLERLRRRMTGEPAIDRQVARLRVRIHEHEVEQSSRRAIWTVWSKQFGYKLAMSLILITLPVLGYMSHQLIQEYFRARESMASKFMGYENPAGDVKLKIITLVFLLIVLPVLGYVAYQLRKFYLVPRGSGSGVKSLGDQDGAKTTGELKKE